MVRNNKPGTTEPIYQLVGDVLPTIQQRYPGDIIDEVFYAIEHNRRWLARYEALEQELGKLTVNRWIAKYVAREVGLKKVGVSPAKRSSLIKTYSLLK